MKVCKRPNVTQITEHVYSYKYAVHLLNLHQGESKQEQQDGDDNVAGIFVSTDRHLGNSVHHR